MEISSLSQYIKKAIEYYDNQNIKYKNIIETEEISYKYNINEITFKNPNIKYNIFEFETLGYFDNTSHIWVWGWVLQEFSSDQTKLCRDLLNYGLKLDPNTITDEHLFIKPLLINSRILIEEDSQLDINLAIYSYIVRDNFKFIYPRRKYLDDSKKSYITFYLLIK